ncbi:MAG: hypothetical protein AAGM38_14785 [Pseudomonadota bacterium]
MARPKAAHENPHAAVVEFEPALVKFGHQISQSEIIAAADARFEPIGALAPDSLRRIAVDIGRCDSACFAMTLRQFYGRRRAHAQHIGDGSAALASRSPDFRKSKKYGLAIRASLLLSPLL